MVAKFFQTVYLMSVNILVYFSKWEKSAHVWKLKGPVSFHEKEKHEIDHLLRVTGDDSIVVTHVVVSYQIVV